MVDPKQYKHNGRLMEYRLEWYTTTVAWVTWPNYFQALNFPVPYGDLSIE